MSPTKKQCNHNRTIQNHPYDDQQVQKTPLNVIQTPNYHKNITLHNLLETKQKKYKANHPHFLFPSPSTTKSFVMFCF
jgi:hypothetical protein